MIDEKVSISISPTPEKINRFNVKVQGFRSYTVYEYKTNLERTVAEDLVESYRQQYPDHCHCVFK